MPPTPESIHPIMSLEAERRRACVAGDTATLRSIMANDCVYVHSSGISETKAEMIARFENGELVYRTLDIEQAVVREYGDVLLVNGDMHIVVTTGGTNKDFVSRYLQVWHRVGVDWQMVSWQSTLLPS